MKILILAFFFLFSCTNKKGQLANQRPSGHHELYSRPALPTLEVDPELIRVVIASTNDVQGRYGHQEVSFQDKYHPQKQTMTLGGVDIISAYFQILREHYGQILLVDSGDIFAEKKVNVNDVKEYYANLGYDALTIGLNDFGLKLSKNYPASTALFKEFAAKSKTPLLISNLYELKTGRLVEWSGLQPYVIREVNGVKIGIIGLIPDDVVEQTPIDSRLGLFVENMLQSTLKNARLVRSLGAEIVVVLTHQGLDCGAAISQQLNLPLDKVNFEPQRSDLCDLTSPLGEYLLRLPPQLIDVVISGRNHQKVANFVNSVLVLSGFGEGKSFNFAEFFVDRKTRRIHTDKTIAHQPVMFCHEFFKETNDCYYEDPAIDHKLRIPAKFLGRDIIPNVEMQQKFMPYFQTNKQSSNNEIPKSLPAADLLFRNKSNGDVRLLSMNLNGKELITVLEEDYNHGKESNWHPSPFKMHASRLNITIKGAPLDMDHEYKIFIDLEDARNHPLLKKFIAKSSTISLHHQSWNTFQAEDIVSTSLASQMQ
jgi:2',3'-cyclic-nucleotide 2'-phosphodiesterase (5'-nucleotidase family)